MQEDQQGAVCEQRRVRDEAGSWLFAKVIYFRFVTIEWRYRLCFVPQLIAEFVGFRCACRMFSKKASRAMTAGGFYCLVFEEMIALFAYFLYGCCCC